MAFDGWGFALQSAVNGYMRGRRIVEDQEDADYQRELRNRQRKAWAKQDALDAALTDAGKPVGVVDESGTVASGNVIKPDYADNRDIGQAGEPGGVGGPKLESAGTDDVAGAVAGGIERAANSIAKSQGAIAAQQAEAAAESNAELAQSAQEQRKYAVAAGQAASAEAAAMAKNASTITPVAMQAAAPELTATDPLATAAPVASPAGAAIAAGPQLGDRVSRYSVAGKSFRDQATAQAAADTYNSADMRAQRASNVFAQHGDIGKSMAMEASRRSAEAAEMQLADARWKRDLGTAMRGGHDGLAKLATSSEAGPMAGLSVRAVPGADGKIVYATVDKDGVATPIPGLPSFANDENGMIQAAWMLDRTITPQQRMEHFTQQRERERQQQNSDRTYALAVNADTRAAGAESRAIAADARAGRISDLHEQEARLKLDDAKLNAKIPPAVKMQVDGIRKELETITSAMAKAQADGTWDPTAPGAKQLLERQAVLGLNMRQQLKPYIKEGGEAADPLGLRGGSKGGAAPVTPSDQQRDQFLSKKVPAPKSYKDPAWDAIEADVSKLTGVPQEVMRTIRTVGERSNDGQVSSAGAKKTTQFTENSRNLFLKKYGVDAYSDNAREQVLAQALHLKESFDRTGSWDKAMAGFNGGISGEKGTNKTAENKAYAGRTSAALRSETAAAGQRAADWAKNRRGQPVSIAAQSAAPAPEPAPRQIDYSGIGGRMSVAAGQADPMRAPYREY